MLKESSWSSALLAAQRRDRDAAERQVASERVEPQEAQKAQKDGLATVPFVPFVVFCGLLLSLLGGF